MLSDDPRLSRGEHRIKKRNMVKLRKTCFKRKQTLGLQIGRIGIECSDSGFLQAKGKFLGCRAKHNRLLVSERSNNHSWNLSHLKLGRALHT